MSGAIALGALWHPLGGVHFLVCATRVLQWDSKKLQKQFKTNGLGHFLGILLGRLTWTIWTTDMFPCSVRLVFHFCEAFSCSAALIFIDEIAFPCRRRSICTRSAPSGGSELSCLDGSVWTGPLDLVCLDPVCLGPVCLDPVCLDPVCLGPVCLDPVCLDPVCLDPVCLDPVCLDSVCLDPVYLDLSNLLSRALLPTTRLEAPPSLLSASAGCYICSYQAGLTEQHKFIQETVRGSDH
ncbi:MAG: hypothetical protein VYC97_10670, partial [SAR324 cluster bacterium]|nr:hypothetical protein [SAR324 cluster bacterium]